MAPQIETRAHAPPPRPGRESSRGAEARDKGAPRAQPEGTRGTAFSFALLATGWCVAFVICAIWQVAAILSRATATDPPSTPPAAAPEEVALLPVESAAAEDMASRPSGANATAPVPIEPSLIAAAVDTSASFEANAEGSEQAIAVGLRPALDAADEAFALGVVPPPAAPRVSCGDVFVYIVTVAEGAPMSSTASLGIGKNGRARFRRPGQQIGDWTVLTIDDDWTGLNPDVWLEKDGAVCRAKLSGNSSRAHAAPTPAPRPPAPKTRVRSRSSRR
jgi:hypothetical protein